MKKKYTDFSSKIFATQKNEKMGLAEALISPPSQADKNEQANLAESP